MNPMYDIAQPAHGPAFFAHFHGAFGPKLAELARPALMKGIRLDRAARLPEQRCLESLDFGGAYRHTVVGSDRMAGTELEHHLDVLTEQFRPIVEQLTGRPVITSPYPKSAATVKWYGPGDCQGWHYDTNPITLLFWLTDCPAGGELEVAPYGRASSDEMRLEEHPTIAEVLGDEPTWKVRCKAGDVLVMAGRRYVHQVLTQPPGADRVMVAVNLYHPDDTWRPAAVDGVVYNGQ